MPSIRLLAVSSIAFRNGRFTHVCLLSGFGKLWISRTRKTLRGVQMVSEHAAMLGKAFGILIRHQIPLSDVCVRLELPGSIGEAVQLMVKQAMARIRNDIQPPSPPHQDETNDVSE